MAKRYPRVAPCAEKSRLRSNTKAILANAGNYTHSRYLPDLQRKGGAAIAVPNLKQLRQSVQLKAKQSPTKEISA